MTQAIKKHPAKNRVLEVSVENLVVEACAGTLLSHMLAHDGSLGLADALGSKMSAHESVVVIGLAVHMCACKKHAATLPQ